MFGPRSNCGELAGVRRGTVLRGFMNLEMGGNRGPSKGQGAGRSLGREQFAAASAQHWHDRTKQSRTFPTGILEYVFNVNSYFWDSCDA